MTIQDMLSWSYPAFCLLVFVTLCEGDQPQYIVYQPTLNSGGSGQHPVYSSEGSGQHPVYSSEGSGQHPVFNSGGSGQYQVYNQLLTRDPHPTVLIKPRVPNQQPVVVTLPALEVAKGIYHVDLSSALTNLGQGHPRSKELPRTDGKRICLPGNSSILPHLTVQPESVQKIAGRIDIYCYRTSDLRTANIIK